MSTRTIIRGILRKGPARFADLRADRRLAHLGDKAVEKALAAEQEAGAIRSHVFCGNAKIYYLTWRGAVLEDVNPKRFARAPGAQATCETIAMRGFEQRTNPPQNRLTEAEFGELFPNLLTPGICRTRYYVDRTSPDPLLGILVPEWQLTVRDFARKIRRAYVDRIGNPQSKKRPPSEGWRLMFAERLVQITGITATKAKADRVRDALRNEPFRVVIVPIPELSELLPRRRTV